MQPKESDKAVVRRRKKAEAARQWRKDNPELSRQKARERYQRDKAAAAAKVQKWRKEHPEEWARIQRASNLKMKYGLTLEQFDALLLTQGGTCAICQSADPKSKNGASRPGQFHVDHDHTTGAVRGLLCSPCNTGLGSFRDDTARLAEAIRYLGRHRP